MLYLLVERLYYLCSKNKGPLTWAFVFAYAKRQVFYEATQLSVSKATHFQDFILTFLPYDVSVEKLSVHVCFTVVLAFCLLLYFFK